MAHFIPKNYDFEQRPLSEQEVFEEIREHLSDDWVVFHSFCCFGRNKAGELKDREIDFLLYHERKGFLAIEVKGGTIACVNGQWLQNGRPISPVDQARRGKYAIRDLLEKHLGREVPLKFAHAVCFPSCDRNATVWPPDAEGIVITKDDLQDIENIAYRLIDNGATPEHASGHVELNEILDILSPEFEYVQPLREQILDDEKVFRRLTEQQCLILNALRNFPRLLIEGGAGTGKTVLAVKKAQMVAAEGGNALLLCFNELLASKIRRNVGFYSSTIKVRAFFEYCVELMGIPQDEYDRYKDRPELYSQILPGLMEKYFSQNSVNYEAVIVDEGQDFTPQMWAIVQRLVAPQGQFYVFYDPDQNIFRDALNVPDFGIPPVSLTQNCRSTRKIYDAMTPYRKVEMQLLDGSPEGCDVIDRRGDCRQLLEEELDRLFKVERVLQSDVVVLGGHSLAHTSVGAEGKVGQYRLVERMEQPQSKDVLYYTYMKFKGCEAKVVILLDVDEQDPRWNASGMYTAMSRAIHKLVVLRKA